jgi:hypothetical protein
MKRLILLVVALMQGLGVAFAAENELPAGTFVFSDDANYFGRMTVTREGAFTGMFLETFDEASFGKRVFSGRVAFASETTLNFRYPQATYYHPFGPSERLTIRHTPDGPTEYLAIITVTIPNRIGSPSIYVYELPSNHVLEDPDAAGHYTMLFRGVPGTEDGEVPGGTGWGVMRLGADGRYRCTGRLANNKSFSFGFNARADRKLDLFRSQSPATFYPRRGGKLRAIFYGTIQLREIPEVSDADGAMRWKLDIGSEKDFRTDLQIVASRFVPTADVRSLFASDGTPGTAPSLGVVTFSHESFLEPKVARFRFDNPPVVLPAFRTLVPKLSWFTTRRNSFPGRFRGDVRPGEGLGKGSF